MTAVVILIVAGCILLIEGTAFLVYTIKAPIHRKRTLEFLLHRRSRPFTAHTQGASQTTPSRYSEHPFTGWSLSPEFRNIYGEKVHNRQGFRCSPDLEELDPNAVRIYCAGGSTTYCTNIERNEDTWPHLLSLSTADSINGKVEVINGGVGGFNTFQSYIRLSAYIDDIRPDIVIVYHAKNDLTPFYNGNPANGKPLPDYSNCMRSLSFCGMSHSITPAARWSFVGKLWALWRLSPEQTSLDYVYDTRKRLPDIPTLLAARNDFSIVETMQRNMVALCRSRGVTLVYVTQRVNDAELAPYVTALNQRIRGLEDRQNGCFIFDLDHVMPHDAELLADKMHFSDEGCRRVARHIGGFLAESRLLARLTIH